MEKILSIFMVNSHCFFIIILPLSAQKYKLVIRGILVFFLRSRVSFKNHWGYRGSFCVFLNNKITKITFHAKKKSICPGSVRSVSFLMNIKKDT